MELSRVGPFELMHRLGAGGMAETFAAVRRGPGGFEQWVCIKRILPDRDDDPSQVELFLDEARLLAQLRNGNIVKVYDFGEADGSYYMALELIEGIDLSGLLRALRKENVRLPVHIAMYIAVELLRALHYAHTVALDGAPLGLVHRDVSPSNVLLARQGEVKLTDFGIAMYAGRKHKTRTGFVRGKVAYMSPEQVRAEALDARTDLFAAGIILFELLSGQHPFDGPNEIALLTKLNAGRRARIEELVPGLPAGVVALVDGLLEPERDKRLASAAHALARIPHLDSAFSAQAELAALVLQYTPARAALRSSERLVVPAGLPSPPAREAERSSDTPPPLADRAADPGDPATSGVVHRNSGTVPAGPRSLLMPALLLVAAVGVVGTAWLWMERATGGRTERSLEPVPLPPARPPSPGGGRAGSALPESAEASSAGRSSDALANRAWAVLDAAGDVALDDGGRASATSVPLDRGEVESPDQSDTADRERPARVGNSARRASPDADDASEDVRGSGSRKRARSGASVSPSDF